MKKIAQGIVRLRKLILTVAVLLLIPSAIGAVAFTCSMIYLIQRYKKEKLLKKEREAGLSGGIKFVGEGMESTLSQI